MNQKKEDSEECFRKIGKTIEYFHADGKTPEVRHSLKIAINGLTFKQTEKNLKKLNRKILTVSLIFLNTK